LLTFGTNIVDYYSTIGNNRGNASIIGKRKINITNLTLIKILIINAIRDLILSIYEKTVILF